MATKERTSNQRLDGTAKRKVGLRTPILTQLPCSYGVGAIRLATCLVVCS
jgi:hypothetical protein